MTSLKELLGAPKPIEGVKDPFFEPFGLLHNPFPPNRTIIPEVLYDQRQGLEQFAVAAKGILTESPERRAIGIIGGTGVGKTHFMRYCRNQLEAHCKEIGFPLAFVEFQAGSGRTLEIVREAFRVADAVCRAHGETDFLTAILRKLENDGEAVLEETIELADLHAVLTLLLESSRPDFQPRGRDKQFGFEAFRDFTRRWLLGEPLSQTERKYLGVYTRISTASMAVRVLRETFFLARRLNVMMGMMLCIDEVETLFTGSLRVAQYQSFLQDLRYLYDEAVKDERGYSVLILSASTTNGASNLQNINYPVYQRLGFEGPSRILLVPIENFREAQEFAHIYVDFGHEQWKGTRGAPAKPKKDPATLLSRSELNDVYDSVAGGEGAQTRKISQATLLDALHKAVEEKRAT
jgi:hypothetical protein